MFFLIKHDRHTLCSGRFQTGKSQIIGKTDRLSLPHIFHRDPEFKGTAADCVSRTCLGDLYPFSHIDHGCILIKSRIGKYHLGWFPLCNCQFISFLITVVLHTALPGHIVDRFPFRLLVIHAEIKILFLIPAPVKGVKAIDHGQFFYYRRINNDLAAGKIQCQPRFHRNRHIIDRNHIQSAHHSASIQKAVQHAPFIIHISLFRFKIIHGQKLAVKIFISLKGKILHVFHWLYSFLLSLSNP